MKTLILSLVLLASFNSFASNCKTLLKNADVERGKAFGLKTAALNHYNLVADEHDRTKACENLSKAVELSFQSSFSYMIVSGMYDMVRIVCNEDYPAEARQAEFWRDTTKRDQQHQENVTASYKNTYNQFCAPE